MSKKVGAFFGAYTSFWCFLKSGTKLHLSRKKCFKKAKESHAFLEKKKKKKMPHTKEQVLFTSS